VEKDPIRQQHGA
jgi:hypothetical protein